MWAARGAVQALWSTRRVVHQGDISTVCLFGNRLKGAGRNCYKSAGKQKG